MRTRWILGISLLSAIACSNKPVPETPTRQDTVGAKPALTAAECSTKGGEVVGDIGDGAVHRPDYRCAATGEPPLGEIAADPGGPVAIEGAVCCKRK
jgi:hypothetical protein